MKKYKIIFLFVALIAGPSVFAVSVTFKVDMQLQTVPAEGVHIAGSFQGWDPGATAMTLESGSVYYYTVDFTEGETIEYKFINGDEWGEDESVPPACNQNNNRFLVIPAEDIILEPVCFGACEPCGTPVEVTFQVDMSEQTVAPEGVHAAGSFQGWNPASTELLPMGDDIYAVTLTLSENQYLEFKYINGNDWPGEEAVPAACGVPDGVAGYNRFYTVPAGGGSLEALCFASCEPCGYVPIEVFVTFRVDMSMDTVSSDGVFFVSDFQGWDPTANPMTDLGSGIWEATFMLMSGDHHQYKFINGNTWDEEEIVPEECGEDNGQGGYNRFVNVPEENITLDDVCFSSCEPCTVGTESSKSINKNFSVYPNPFKDELILSFNELNVSNVIVELIDVFGQEVLRVNKERILNNFTLSTPEIVEGIYFFRITYMKNNDEVTDLIKIIKN